MYKIGEEEMVSCPYNRFHVVSKLRIQKHITKCQKNYPDVKLATCFYNFTHRLKPEDMLAHYEICSHKTRIDACRYSEPYRFKSSSTSVNNDVFNEEFPDINTKPKIFTERHTSSPSFSSTLDDSGDSDFSESENNLQVNSDHRSCDEDDEPLPLPKTVSKAFVCVLPKPDKFTSDTSGNRAFGRGKTFGLSSPKPTSGTPDHSLPDYNTVEGTRENTKKMPIFYLKHCGSSTLSSTFKNCVKLKSTFGSGESITSSMFDDMSTFKSEEVISEEESCEEDSRNNDFNECLKI